MINYFLGKKIETLISNCTLNNLNWFKDEIRCKMKDENINEEDFEKFFMGIHSQLIGRIVNDVSNFIKGNPPNIFTRYNLALMSPSICGYDFHDENMSLGILYCIVYYAYTGKKANSVTASKQNHILHAYTTQILKELDDEN